MLKGEEDLGESLYSRGCDKFDKFLGKAFRPLTNLSVQQMDAFATHPPS